MRQSLSVGAIAVTASRSRLLSTKPVHSELVWKQIRKDAQFSISDMSSPSQWYPLARKTKRTIIAHVGPTNSGKTYTAMKALMEASTGMYCAPLRLLAWEGYEKLTRNEVKCSLLTGQEKEASASDTHISCTVEMANINKPCEVAILDEYQLMGDASRGWAFTRVILGVPAMTLYVCGHPSALALLSTLCRETGDILKVVKFDRLGPLEVEDEGIESLENIKRGDCLIAFSRRTIHHLKQIVEADGTHSCCVVYGALPPEARKKQAQLFNDRGNNFNVLIASDAIGMGLNLDIRRIVFTAIEKYDGQQQRFLSIPEVKQISGRAGRYGSLYPDGYVSSVRSTEIKFLKYALEQKNPQVKQAGLLPRYEQLSVFASLVGKTLLVDVIDEFHQHVTIADFYSFSDLTEMRRIAALLQHLPLTFSEQYLFGMSPVDSKNLEQASEFLRFCTAHAFHKQVSVSCGALTRRLPLLRYPKTEADLQQLENIHGVLDLYLWLANRLPGSFHEASVAKDMRRVCAQAVEHGLHAITKKRRPRLTSF